MSGGRGRYCTVCKCVSEDYQPTTCYLDCGSFQIPLRCNHWSETTLSFLFRVALRGRARQRLTPPPTPLSDHLQNKQQQGSLATNGIR